MASVPAAPSGARPPVSAVVPTLDDRKLLGANQPPLLAEPGREDDSVVVDDTGEGALAENLAREFPAARQVADRTADFALR